MAKVYPFTCPHCRAAPPRGQWPRSWKWKTQRGFDKHKCYADEQQREPSVKTHPNRDSEALPFWLEGGERVECPLCKESFSCLIPRKMTGRDGTRPGLSFSCPLCNGAIQFVPGGEAGQVSRMERVCSICGSEMEKKSGKYGSFWGCATYTKKNPCRGKSKMVGISIPVYNMFLVALTDAENDGYDCRDPLKVARDARLEAKEERRKRY